MSDLKELDTPEILFPALRQYQHNDCSGLLAGFDHDETVKIVANIRRKVLDEAIELFKDDDEKYMYKSEQARNAIEKLK